MKPRVLLLSACIGALTATVFACTTTTSVPVDDEDKGPNTGKVDDDKDDDKDPQLGEDSGTSTKEDAGKGNNPPSSNCESYCKAIEAAKCEATPESCVETCEAAEGIPAPCNGYYDALLQCGAKAKIECDEDGEPGTSDCTLEFAALRKCIISQNSDAGASDAGASDGGTSDGGASDGGASDGGTANACYTPAKAVDDAFLGAGPANRCTEAQSNAFIDACFGDGDDAACDAAFDALPNACRSCFGYETDEDPPPPSYSPVLFDLGEGLDYNDLACLAVVVGKPECANVYTNDIVCQLTACGTCTTQATFNGCVDEAYAQGGACENAVSAACITALEGATEAQINQCQSTAKPPSTVEALKKVAKVLCVQGAPQ